MREFVEKLFVLAIHERGRYHQAMQIAPAGDRAVLVELGEVIAEELHSANARVLAVPHVIRATPGHSSLYVVFDGPPDREALARAIATSSADTTASGRELEIGVAFDGEDFAEFLTHAGLTREEFLERVDGLRLVARYIGFRGGFAYLDGWPEEWTMPRRSTSRPVAAGSFAIAGSVAAFYPIDSPGGWNIVGHTAVDLEDAIAPGDVLVISPRASAGVMERRKAGRLKPAAPPGVEVVAPLSIWTDRPFDEVAAALANRAAGNDGDAHVLECPLVGPRVRFRADAVIAWCAPDLRIETEHVRAGEERSFGRITGGLRGYLAIGARAQAVDAPRRTDRLRIRVTAGPHDLGIGDIECEVTPQLDRVGIRLRPLQPIGVRPPADLRSIGMQTGTVQLHPNGDLVAMGPDHPVTGGYLQPFTVLWDERWKLAQLVPGERVTFVVA